MEYKEDAWSWPLPDEGRVKRAKSVSLFALTRTESGPSAQCKGSTGQVYHVTLQDCTCVDFMKNKQPCKHMIRLAIGLGLLDQNGRTQEQSNYEIGKDLVTRIASAYWYYYVVDAPIIPDVEYDSLKRQLFTLPSESLKQLGIPQDIGQRCAADNKPLQQPSRPSRTKFTGHLKAVSHKEAKNILAGKQEENVLVVGKRPSAKAVLEAQRNGMKMISEQEFYDMANIDKDRKVRPTYENALKYLVSHHQEYIDKTAKGGCLYFFDEKVAKYLKEHGYTVLRAKNGIREMKERPAWYIKKEKSDDK